MYTKNRILCQVFRLVIAQIIISGENEGRYRGLSFYLPFFGSGPLVNDDRYLGGSEGLKGVFRDGTASEAAMGFPEIVKRDLGGLRASWEDLRAS